MSLISVEIIQNHIELFMLQFKSMLIIIFITFQQLWDYIFLVRTSIEDWKKTPWRKIDVENMDIECKKFAKDVRLLDKEMRTWDAYLMLEATVKNMLTSLRAVGELQNPAIRERHWIQLMASTKVCTKLSVFTPVHIVNIVNTRDIYTYTFRTMCSFVNKQMHNVLTNY